MANTVLKKRYTDLNSWLRNRFGCRVQKITVDAGLTCPNRDGTLSDKGCIYCNARGSGTGAHGRGLSISQQIIQAKQWLKKRYHAKKFLAYFQSYSNTYAPLHHLKRLYNEALNVEDVVGLSIGTRPDCVDEPILDLLTSYTSTHMIWVEYGLQSAHDATLTRINRGHDFSSFENAVAATQHRGIHICVHVILGLPGETKQQMLATANTLAAMGIDGIKIHLLYVIKDTPLAQMYCRGEYKCLDQSEYVDIVCDFIERLPPGIVIQRLTGDPHRNELLAPEWSLKKRQTLDMIKDTLVQRDSWQGKALGFDIE